MFQRNIAEDAVQFEVGLDAREELREAFIVVGGLVGFFMLMIALVSYTTIKTNRTHAALRAESEAIKSQGRELAG